MALFTPVKKKDPYALNASLMPSGTTSSSATLRKPTTPVVTTQPAQYAASGMTGQYAQNPTNYTPTTNPPPTTTTTPSYTNTYLDTLKRLATERANTTSTNADAQAKLLQDSYDRQNARTSAMAPTYQKNFDTFKTNVGAGIADQEAQSAQDIQNTKDTYGEALRRSAQANREVNQGIQGTFAGLGTLDSSAFQQQTLNQGNRFVAGQQSTMRQQANDVSGIQRSLGEYKRQASLAIDQEEQNLQSRLYELGNTMDKNSVEYETAVRKLYNDSYNTINDIETGLAQAEYEMAKTQQGQNLSPEFLKTGVPQTQEDFIYRTQNPGAFEGKLGGGVQANQGKQEIIDAIKAVTNSPTGLDSVFGYGNINPLNRLPASGAQTTKANVDRLRSLVSLENASKLKGQGQITESERKLLSDAATILSNPWIDPAQAKNELERLSQQFGGQPQITANDPLGLGLGI